MRFRNRAILAAAVVALGGAGAAALAYERRIPHKIKARIQAKLEPQDAVAAPAVPAPTLPPIQREYQVAQDVFAGGLKNGWADWGWADRDIGGPGPAKVDFSGYGGWVLHHSTQAGPYGAVAFRFKAPKDYGDFLELRVETDNGPLEPLLIGSRYRFQDKDGWQLVIVPMYELNPYDAEFSGLRIRAHRPVGKERVLLDKIALTTPLKDKPAAPKFPGRDGVLTIRCDQPGHTISPLIYGVAGRAAPEDMRAGAYRLGGNPVSRMNWKLGNAWNTASDWYYQNVALDFTWRDFIEIGLKRNAPVTVTVPLLGWVAKDTSSYSFPVSVYGPQQDVDQYHPDRGNGVTKAGKEIPPGDPSRTSVRAPPEMIREWVEVIRRETGNRPGGGVHSFILDNEPALWNSTHRDVHPEPLSYDELLDRTIRYGSAVRAADPQAVIAGPAEWGWSNYFYSAKDVVAGFDKKPDRRAHGDVPLLDWYLQRLQEHEKKTGVRILDVVDLHLYPQGKNIYAPGGGGGTDPDTVQRRLRSTRALWDPSYVDESWIKEAVMLIPRLKSLIAKNYPGRGISIGEWNFGAENHISGGLATAEALGRFAEGGITSAYYWTAPKSGSPSYWGFRAFRNFDGKGSAFQERYVPSTGTKGASLFASRDAAGTRLVAVVLNLESGTELKAKFDLKSCGAVANWSTSVYAGRPQGFAASKSGTADIADVFPPYSIAILDVRLKAAASR